ncbi:MAG: transcription antitermination factor NusB [Gemmatimonadetes bacterium]|nr:transcription antitermination factor NusB [Gemmatimonadota bacterium]
MPLTRSEVRLRRQARARTLQALYAWEAAGSMSLGDAAMRLWDDLALSADVREVAGPMMRTVEAHREQIDAAIVAAADNWRMERIGAIERAVLRLATAELIRGEVPPLVAIQEALHLTERFASPGSAKFVNGVLDTIARRLGRL